MSRAPFEVRLVERSIFTSRGPIWSKGEVPRKEESGFGASASVGSRRYKVCCVFLARSNEFTRGGSLPCFGNLARRSSLSKKPPSNPTIKARRCPVSISQIAPRLRSEIASHFPLEENSVTREPCNGPYGILVWSRFSSCPK